MEINILSLLGATTYDPLPSFCRDTFYPGAPLAEAQLQIASSQSFFGPYCFLMLILASRRFSPNLHPCICVYPGGRPSRAQLWREKWGKTSSKCPPVALSSSVIGRSRSEYKHFPVLYCTLCPAMCLGVVIRFGGLLAPGCIGSRSE